MTHIIQTGKWLFEMKELRGMKVEEYGKPYSALTTIRIIDGELRVDGLISKQKLEKTDREELEKLVTTLGFSAYTYSNFNEDGKQEIIKKVIK